MLLNMVGPMTIYHFESVASVDSVSRVVDWAQKAATGHPEVAAASINALIVCLHELVANVVLHAKREDGAPMFRVGLQIESEHLAISIEDNGDAFDPIRDVPEILAEENRPSGAGGLGVRIVCELVDKIFYNRIGEWNCLRLEFA